MSNTPQALARVKHSSEEAAQQQQQNQNQNPLSCEVCRRRKTKCDRKLPSCTHCIDAKVACHYPEAKQRGPQVGYLAVLESRLVNTEAALYDALSRLYHAENGCASEPQPTVDRTVKALSERYSNMPYSAKTSEWNHQPLLAEEDRQRWWIARQQILAESETQTHARNHHHHHRHSQNQQQQQHQMSSPPTIPDQQTRHHRTMSHSSARTVDTGEPGFVSPEALNSSTPSTRAAAAVQAPYYHSPAEMKSTASEHQHSLSSNPSPGVNVPINVDPEIAAEMDEEQLMKYF